MMMVSIGLSYSSQQFHVPFAKNLKAIVAYMIFMGATEYVHKIQKNNITSLNNMHNESTF